MNLFLCPGNCMACHTLDPSPELKVYVPGEPSISLPCCWIWISVLPHLFIPQEILLQTTAMDLSPLPQMPGRSHCLSPWEMLHINPQGHRPPVSICIHHQNRIPESQLGDPLVPQGHNRTNQGSTARVPVSQNSTSCRPLQNLPAPQSLLGMLLEVSPLRPPRYLPLGDHIPLLLLCQNDLGAHLDAPKSGQPHLNIGLTILLILLQPNQSRSILWPKRKKCFQNNQLVQ